MKTIKNRFILLVTAVVLALGLCLGLAACGGEKDLSAPVNVTVTGDTLSWDAVKDASAGYTVKINSDETTTVSETSLDLTTVKTKLVTGNNTLAVKANATEKKGESAYSEEVTYVYVVSAEEEATEFKASVNAIGTVTLGSESAISAAKTKYAALTDGAKEFEGVSDAIATLKTKDGEYFALLVNAAGTLTSTIEQSSFAGVKTALDKATAYYATLIDQSAASEAKTALDAKQTAYDTVTGAIKADVDAFAETFDALLEKQYDGNDNKPTLADYKALEAKEEAVEELGVYAKSYWDETYSAKSTAAAAKKAEILSIAISIEDKVEVLYDGNSTASVSVLYRGVNILGKAVTGGSAPALTVTIDDGTNGGVDTSAAAFTGNNGEYYYTVNFIPKSGDDLTTAGYALKVTYTIGEGQPKTVTYKAFNDDIYFSNDTHEAIEGNEIVIYGAVGANTYLDIYETKYIDRGESIPTIKGSPLIKGISVKEITGEPVSARISLAKFRKYLAINYPEFKGISYEVRFVVYNFADDGEITMSNIKSALVSLDTPTLYFTDDDTRLDIFNIPGGNAFTWNLGSDSAIDYAYEIVNNATLWDEAYINVYDVADKDAQTYDFMKAEPFATFTFPKFKGPVYWNEINAKINEKWENLPRAKRKTKYTFVFAMQVKPNDTAKAQDYTDSKLNYAIKDGGERQTKDYDMTKTITNSIIDNGIWGGKPYYFSLVKVPTDAGWNTWYEQFNDSIDDFAITAANAADYFDVLIQAYSGEEPQMQFQVRAPLEHKGYSYTTFIHLWLRDYFLKDGKDNTTVDFTIYLSIVLKDKVDGKANPLATYFKASDTLMAAGDAQGQINCREYTFLESNLKSIGNQLGFNTDGTVFTILEENQPGVDKTHPGDRGSIFDEMYGVKHIELVFNVGGTDYTAYFLKGELYEYNEANHLTDYRLTLYSDLEKSKDGHSCERVANGWMNVSDFITWVKATYGIDLPDKLAGVTFKTKIVHDGSYFIDEIGYSETITCPAAENAD